MIAKIATGEVDDPHRGHGKDRAASELGRKGGLKGGKSRALSLTAEQRTEIAREAAKKRWNKT